MCFISNLLVSSFAAHRRALHHTILHAWGSRRSYKHSCCGVLRVYYVRFDDCHPVWLTGWLFHPGAGWDISGVAVVPCNESLLWIIVSLGRQIRDSGSQTWAWIKVIVGLKVWNGGWGHTPSLCFMDTVCGNKLLAWCRGNLSIQRASSCPTRGQTRPRGCLPVLSSLSRKRRWITETQTSHKLSNGALTDGDGVLMSRLVLVPHVVDDDDEEGKMATPCVKHLRSFSPWSSPGWVFLPLWTRSFWGLFDGGKYSLLVFSPWINTDVEEAVPRHRLACFLLLLPLVSIGGGVGRDGMRDAPPLPSTRRASTLTGLLDLTQSIWQASSGSTHERRRIWTQPHEEIYTEWFKQARVKLSISRYKLTGYTWDLPRDLIKYGPIPGRVNVFNGWCPQKSLPCEPARGAFICWETKGVKETRVWFISQAAEPRPTIWKLVEAHYDSFFSTIACYCWETEQRMATSAARHLSRKESGTAHLSAIGCISFISVFITYYNVA